MDALSERVEEVRGWALSRIRWCRETEAKFGQHWNGKGPAQALVEAWAERRALQAVLEMLSPGYLDRIEAVEFLPVEPAKCRECGSITDAHRRDCSRHGSPPPIATVGKDGTG